MKYLLNFEIDYYGKLILKVELSKQQIEGKEMVFSYSYLRLVIYAKSCEILHEEHAHYWRDFDVYDGTWCSEPWVSITHGKYEPLLMYLPQPLYEDVPNITKIGKVQPNKEEADMKYILKCTTKGPFHDTPSKLYLYVELDAERAREGKHIVQFGNRHSEIYTGIEMPKNTIYLYVKDSKVLRKEHYGLGDYKFYDRPSDIGIILDNNSERIYCTIRKPIKKKQG